MNHTSAIQLAHQVVYGTFRRFEGRFIDYNNEAKYMVVGCLYHGYGLRKIDLQKLLGVSYGYVWHAITNCFLIKEYEIILSIYKEKLEKL